MRGLLIIALVLSLAGCQAKPTKTTSSKPSQTSTKVVKPKAKKPAPLKARESDLIGHSFVNVDDHDQVLQFTASTSGYYLDVQTRQNGEDFTSSQAGIFNGKLTIADLTYTFTGTAQPNASASTLSFKKISKTKMQQLPDGPIYKHIKDDDLSTLNQ
ncbi:hypothetical protein [Lacticaseibacillus porcinae]|uniref:hypothetical protein n=1 Tax=Lacticaseibacillus porcinae TaxID=1123687 RepID=UPI000F7AEBAE|nr:hypothetical protein [Lacticaseibacillus porcinae]